MNPALPVLAPAKLASQFLAGGRSPAAWQRLTASLASWIQWGRRAVTLLSFPGQVPPPLRDGPLLGRALELATSGFEPAVEPGALPRRFEGNDWPRRQSRRVERRVAAEFRQVRSLPPRELLASREQLVKSAESSRPPQPLRTAVVSRFDTRARCLDAQAQTAKASESQAAFAAVLARRISDNLRYRLPYTSASVAGTQSLIEQWSTPLDGPAIDHELLDTYAEAFVVATTRESVRMLERRPNRPDVNSPEPPPNAETQPALRLPPEENEPGTLDDRGQHFPGFVSPPRPRFVLSAQPETDRHPAAMLRSGTAEPAAFDWNLSALSAAMKRILDEDARRHGVDV